MSHVCIVTGRVVILFWMKSLINIGGLCYVSLWCKGGMLAYFKVKGGIDIVPS